MSQGSSVERRVDTVLCSTVRLQVIVDAADGTGEITRLGTPHSMQIARIHQTHFQSACIIELQQQCEWVPFSHSAGCWFKSHPFFAISHFVHHLDAVFFTYLMLPYYPTFFLKLVDRLIPVYNQLKIFARAVSMKRCTCLTFMKKNLHRRDADKHDNFQYVQTFICNAISRCHPLPMKYTMSCSAQVSQLKIYISIYTVQSHLQMVRGKPGPKMWRLA